MKKIYSLIIATFALALVANPAYANPTNEHKAQNFLGQFAGNKNVVSYYSGDGATPDRHEIIGEEGQNHYGEDLVMKAGNSGNFHQWFLGWSEEEGYHGEHTLWLFKHSDSCPDGFTLIPNANPFGDDVGWGAYFPEGEDYCAKTNDFKLGDWWEHQELPWTLP